MKIDLIRQNINFKQIKLNEKELKNAQTLYNQIKIEPKNSNNLFIQFT